MENSADPDQTTPWEQSGLGLHGLLSAQTDVRNFRANTLSGFPSVTEIPWLIPLVMTQSEP